VALRALGVLLAGALAASATDPYAPDTPEAGSVEAIRAATSHPSFVSPWVAYVPESGVVPSPSDRLGHIAGAPGELTYTKQAYDYYRALAQASPRVRVESLGTSEEGREILLVAIADEQGLAELDDLKAATAALADPRKTSAEAAEAVIARARPIYYLNAGLHADESGSVEALLELAYRLAVSEQPMIQQIRRNVVVLLNPVSNPDGRDKVADWFYRYLKGRRDYGALPRQSPPYWSKYAYVDINRDTHQQTHAATRAVHHMFHAYHPTVVHDLHEAIALLLTWNGTGPYNPHLDPIVTSEFLELSFHEVQALTSLGLPGVWTWKFGEGFGQHYLDAVAMNHNSLGRGYETWGNTTAETVRRVIDASDTTREWYRPWPPPREFDWSMRDNVNYQQTAILAALDYTARHARELLRNFYRKGANSWRKGLEQPPYAFVIPADQGDRLRVAQMVNRLLDQRIEVSRAGAPLRVAEGSFSAGSFVVRLDQPYRNYAVDLLTPQAFPQDSPHEPYDDISWSLPLHYRVEAVPIADTAIREVPLVSLDAPVHPTGRVEGDGPVYLLRDTGQEALLAARYRLASFPVEVAEAAFRANGREYPAGSWVLRARGGLAAALHEVARELALDFESAPSVPSGPRHLAPAPRVGVWVPWADTDAIGWIRYSLDQRRVPYTYLRDEDIRHGGLREKLDVVVYGHVNLELAEQIQGLPSHWGPMPFKATPQTPHLGTPAESDDITGGIGYAGLAELSRFVEKGGVLVTLGSGSALALETGLVRGVRKAEARGIPLPSDGTGESTGGTRVATPGSHLRVSFARPEHPIAYGYAPRGWVFRANFPVYETPRRWLRMSYCTSCLDGPEDRSGVVLAWGDRDGAPLVVSGGAKGGERLAGAPAILDAPFGRGHVVAFNFNPMHRDLNRGDHRLLWNAILNWNALSPAEAGRRAP
jgi:hypothetical protein